MKKLNKRIIIKFVLAALFFGVFPRLFTLCFLIQCFICAYHFILSYRFVFNEEDIVMFFGLPGSGKTTVLADIIRQTKKSSVPRSVYCNFPIRGALQISRQDIGPYELRQPGDEGALLLLDEGQTIYNCRNAMSKKESERLSAAEIEFFCMHRHRKTMLCCFSQGFEDLDKVIRNRQSKLYYVEKSRFKPFIRIRQISKIIHIDDLQKQIVEGFEFEKFSTRYVYGKRVWHMFDTYAASPLPVISPRFWFDDDGLSAEGGADGPRQGLPS